MSEFEPKDEPKIGGVDVVFVQQCEPLGCFGAVTESAFGYDQRLVNERMQEDGFYYPPLQGVQPVSGEQLTEALDNMSIWPVELKEIFPHPDFFQEGPVEGLDDSEEALSKRLKTLVKTFEEDGEGLDFSGVALWFPRRREGQDPFVHVILVAKVDSREDSPVFTVMDPSEIDGGIFEKTEAEMREMLTPEPDSGLAIAAYSMHQY